MPAPALREDGTASASKSKMLPRLVALVAIVASALSACGGGGGSSGSSGISGSGNNTDISAQLVVSPLQVNVTAQTTDAAPTAVIQVSVQVTSNASTQTQFYIEGSQTENGIDSVSGSTGGSVDNVTVTFKAPGSLGPGTYTDTLTLEGCFDQACTNQVSNSPQTVSVTYTVTQPLPPQPQIYAISPTSATASAPSFTLTVNGSTFVPQSVVLWNGSPLPTTFVSVNQLTAQVPASNITVSGNYSVTVSNVSGGGSSAATFTVMPLPPLSLNKISPSQVTAGGSDFMLTAIGTGFASTSSIAWNGTSLPTTYVSSTVLQAKVTAAQITDTGTVSITVLDSGSQGNSSPINLTIAAPSIDAVAYQMNAAHTGAVTFKTVALPSNSAWSVDVGGRRWKCFVRLDCGRAGDCHCRDQWQFSAADAEWHDWRNSLGAHCIPGRCERRV
jgi:hypothetical protein